MLRLAAAVRLQLVSCQLRLPIINSFRSNIALVLTVLLPPLLQLKLHSSALPDGSHERHQPVVDESSPFASRRWWNLSLSSSRPPSPRAAREPIRGVVLRFGAVCPPQRRVPPPNRVRCR
jgi:hypothetical protein